MENRSCCHDNWEGAIHIAPASAVTIEEKVHESSTTYPFTSSYTTYTFHTRANDLSYGIQAMVPIYSTCGGRLDFPADMRVKNPTLGRYTENSYLTWEWESVSKLNVWLYSCKDFDYTWLKTEWSITGYAWEWLDGRGPTSVLGQISRFGGVRKSTKGWPVKPTMTVRSTYYPTNQSYTGWGCDIQETKVTKSDLNLASKWLQRFIPPDDVNVWGDLCQEAVQDAQAVDVNSLQLVREIFELKDSVIAALRLIRKKADVKSLSKLWLSLKYGLRLTAKDSKEIADATSKAMEPMVATARALTPIGTLTSPRWSWSKNYRYCRARSSREFVISSGLLQSCSVGQQYNYKVYYDPVDSKFNDCIRKLMDWDVFPTLQNIWDLIPLTFVLDWFVDFENYFNIVDSAEYATLLNVLEVIKTRKTTFFSVPLDRFLPIAKEGQVVIGNVEYSRYERLIVPYLTIPRLRLETPQNFHNFVELFAIVVTQLK
jgi:hypothetical protein